MSYDNHSHKGELVEVNGELVRIPKPHATAMTTEDKKAMAAVFKRFGSTHEVTEQLTRIARKTGASARCSETWTIEFYE